MELQNLNKKSSPKNVKSDYRLSNKRILRNSKKLIKKLREQELFLIWFKQIFLNDIHKILFSTAIILILLVSSQGMQYFFLIFILPPCRFRACLYIILVALMKVMIVIPKISLTLDPVNTFTKKNISKSNLLLYWLPFFYFPRTGKAGFLDFLVENLEPTFHYLSK